MAKAKAKPGKLSISDMRKLVNKRAQKILAHDLNESSPTEVKEWIPTGSRWLNSIICRGKYAGIPIGKYSEIAGLSSAGKSYMAAQIAANAQKMGIDVVYFDSESAVDPEFLQKAGCDLENLIYVQAESVEFVLETVEDLMANNPNRMLFIWDSLAMTASKTDIEGDFNPLSSMAVKPRILSKGFAKLTVPLANSQSTFLILNQLKTNITSNIAEQRLEPYFTPGGKAAIYAYSLRIWLTARRGKASFIYDDKNFRVGTEVKAKIKKSRFGSDARECIFKIVWAGDDVKIQDEESWLDAVKSSKHLTVSGSWYQLHYEDGTTEKFQKAHWMKKLESDKFYDRVLQLIEEEVILRFDKKDGEASEFYDIDGEEEA